MERCSDKLSDAGSFLVTWFSSDHGGTEPPYDRSVKLLLILITTVSAIYGTYYGLFKGKVERIRNDGKGESSGNDIDKDKLNHSLWVNSMGPIKLTDNGMNLLESIVNYYEALLEAKNPNNPGHYWIKDPDKQRMILTEKIDERDKSIDEWIGNHNLRLKDTEYYRKMENPKVLFNLESTDEENSMKLNCLSRDREEDERAMEDLKGMRDLFHYLGNGDDYDHDHREIGSIIRNTENFERILENVRFEEILDED